MNSEVCEDDVPVCKRYVRRGVCQKHGAECPKLHPKLVVWQRHTPGGTIVQNNGNIDAWSRILEAKGFTYRRVGFSELFFHEPSDVFPLPEGHDLSFGKHKGKHVSEVPPDYIRWCRKQNPSARMQQMVDKFNQYDQKRGFWAFVHLDMSAWDTCWKLCDDQGPGASAGKVFWTHLEAKGEGDWVDNIVKQKRAYTSSASEEPLAGITPVDTETAEVIVISDDSDC
mmetsp:Transcript_25981/g.61782  ORF Transcript_25981/g.61782 Transcript_25981/m.61782 type:complete len:226 (+) Transcript_25981:82-759(+)